MFGFDVKSSFWISIAERSPTYLLSRLINTVRSAIIFGEGTSANLIFASSRLPLWETRESIVECMSVVMEMPPLFKGSVYLKNRKKNQFFFSFQIVPHNIVH